MEGADVVSALGLVVNSAAGVAVVGAGEKKVVGVVVDVRIAVVVG